MEETIQDIANEDLTTTYLEKKWGCTFRRFGAYSPIDFSLHKNGKLIAVAEFKRRHRTRTEFDDIYLNLQKWMSLQFTSLGLEVPGLFIVAFNDGIFWCDIATIDPSNHRVTGRTDRGRKADIQPVIKIPTGVMIDARL